MNATTTATASHPTQVMIDRYHRTLSAARALRAIYVKSVADGEAYQRQATARERYAAAWSQYVALCHRHGLLAAHS